MSVSRQRLVLLLVRKDTLNDMQMIKTLLGLLMVTGVVQVASGQGFYRNPEPVFSTRPSETSSLQTIDRLGPVGLGIELLQPAFVMRIANIETGSPAENTRQLAIGQIIESVNGEILADIDPRIQLGRILAEAEATDGVVKLKIQNLKDPVEIQIPVLGRYSPTWPLDCPKSDRIVRQVADYLSSPDANPGVAGIGMLFLLSTGEEKDLEPVRVWARSVADKPSTYPWYLGYGGIPLCEYYLRTGDKAVLPGIQKWVDNAVKTQYLDGWIGRGGVSPTYGNGHLNAAGTSVVTFYLLAKECGVEVPNHALQGALVHFFRYAGRGGNPYGDHRTEVGFVDNGKNGLLAFTMAAAAALSPEGEDSVYAAARDVCAMQSFYTTSFMLHGHTGGGIGEIWRSAAMGLLKQRRPKQYREFMDNRQWHYDLSRRFDGSFGILGGAGYDKELWGVAYPLAYTIPRKTLRISGAPPTRFSKPYALPQQPWGVVADNRFLSLEAAADAQGKTADLTGETLANDSSLAFLRRFHGEDQPSDDTIRYYIQHQDHNIRFVAANKVIGINSGYIGWRSPGGPVRSTLMLEFLKHEDPRVRRAMWMAIQTRTDVVDEAIFNLAIEAIRNPDEAWSVKDPALQVVGSVPADWIIPHIDLLLEYLRHEDWWLQNAALIALTPVVADARVYERVLPAVGELVQQNQRTALTAGLMPGMRSRIKAAGPEVHQLASKTLRGAFTEFGGRMREPGGQDVSSTFDAHLEFIAASLADVPGGLDVLYEVARERQPDEILPYKEFFLNAEPTQFGPKLRAAIKPVINDELIPEFVGLNYSNLQKLALQETQTEYPGGSRDVLTELAALHDRAGRAGYNWHMFADLRHAKWNYYSYDPSPEEQVPFDQLISRYREVAVPAGMENWFHPEFDPVAASWKLGPSPFGHYMGELPQQPIHKCGDSCQGPGCYGGTPIKTFWEKEILLLQGTFQIPPIKNGHRYRIRVNDGDHVGAGGGFRIYINGKSLAESPNCVGRGGGGQPKGAFVTREFLEDFKRGEVTIGVKTFLRFNDKYKVKPTTAVSQGKISLHIEEQRLPPIGQDLLIRSAEVIPFLSSEWQASQDPNDRELQAAASKFRYDGRFIPKSEIQGRWKTVGVVKAIADFEPELRLDPRRAPWERLEFSAQGGTDDVTRIWSGDRLLDLKKYEALQMKVLSVQGEEYLFVETGGFSPRHPVEWKSSWAVLKHD